MSEITKDEVIESFREAQRCAGAADCKKIAEAMCMFYVLDNQETVRTGEGRINFYTQPEGPCPNQDQLFCQDNS